MQKPKKAPKKTTVSLSAAHAVKTSAKSAAKSLAAKKVPVVKKKAPPVIITKKGPSSKGAVKAGKSAPVKKVTHKAVVAKSMSHGKSHDEKPTHGKPGAKPESKTDAKKKALAPVSPAVKAAVASGKMPMKSAALKKTSHEVEPSKLEKKMAIAPKTLEQKQESISETKLEAKSKKVREGVERVVETAQPEEEVILTDAEGRRYCRVKDCDQAATVDGGYCRFHYLLFWKNIQSRRKILSEGKLERYIEELTARYPDKFLELLRKDLRSEKDFTAAIQELEIDDSGVDNELEDEAQSYLDEVRGMSSESSSEREEEF
jgi:hypothetical protein